jgi:O-methyltransferase
MLKKMLVHMPIPYSPRVDTLQRLPKLRSWIANAKSHPYYPNRRQVHDHVGRLTEGGPIVYLEFGIQQGHTLKYFSALNSHPSSRFIGFDSFQGLPEAWPGLWRTLPPGAYSTSGVVPTIDDPRVSCVAGWFQDTLPSFLRTFQTDLPLIVHCDADVYASTLYVLCTVDGIMKPGTILMFDDFASMLDDFRALEDYTRAFRRKYEVLCAGIAEAYYNNVAIRLTQ